MAVHGKSQTGNEKWKSENADCLETVRILHQTVVCLRKALEKSQGELQKLKSKLLTETNKIKYDSAIEQLALENHILRCKILSDKYFNNFIHNKHYSMDNTSKCKTNEFSKKSDDENVDLIPENVNHLHLADNEDITDKQKESSVLSYVEEQGNVHKNKTYSEEYEEVDDIELIFTTDDTKIELQEELEPISDNDDSYESKSEINHPIVVTQSVLVETDISKCGIVYDNGTMLPNSALPILSTAPQNILEKEKLVDGKITKLPNLFIKQPIIQMTRPILNENIGSVRDSEAQTDISAVPIHWKSESFLVNNKTSQTFPTLPSKFSIPVKETDQKCSLKLTEKTQEARRILLSDINFTSMVPELSRSVDHLCQNGIRLPNNNNISSPFTMKYLTSPAGVNSGSSYSKFEFNIGNSNWNCYDNSYASDQERSVQDLRIKRKSWRPSVYSLDTFSVNRTSSVPPSPTLRRHSAAISYSNNIDAQFQYTLPDKLNTKMLSNATIKNMNISPTNRRSKTKVSFKESYFSKNFGTRQSLPNMYVDTESGEESTESLIDESEECVRKSIDATLNSIDWPYVGYRYVGRTYSVPNLFLEFSPPLSAKPFIARSFNDLKINYFIKVINKEGRVVGGRIQFVGIIPGKTEPYVGILLPSDTGETDGSFQGLRYFTCEKNYGLFVPFRKVVMVWKV